jgi:hypothetical protein
MVRLAATTSCSAAKATTGLCGGSQKLVATDFDIFVLDAELGPGNVATVNHFNVNEDLFQLDDDIFTALALGALSNDAFRAAADPLIMLDATARILFDRDSTQLYHDADGSGAIQAVQFAVLGSTTLGGSLSAADFFVVGRDKSRGDRGRIEGTSPTAVRGFPRSQ